MSAFGPVDVQPFTRRGVCPALSAPMQTGDGLLSRIAFTDPISPSDLEALCALAIQHGNGLMDITARGGLQFRGLTAESAEALERDVLALDLPLRQGLTVETSPLTGIDQTEIADTRDIVSRICARADALQLHEKLAAKLSVIVDGGGLVDMGDLLADIRLKATRVSDHVFWQLMLGGAEDKALQAGLLRTEHVADSVIDLLMCLAERGSDTRGRDLDIEQVRAVCAGRLVDVRRLPERSDKGANAPYATTVARCNNARPYGIMRLSNDVFAAVVAPAFGQIGADMLAALCHHASTLGLQRLRPGPAHAMFFTGSHEACRALLDHARDAGFVTGADDPRSSIAVCAGKPACASGVISTRDLAEHAATDCASLLDGSFTLHLSGCGKGCAHPTPATLAFAGSSEGLALTFSGRVSDTPQAVLPLADRKAALSRLARLYEKEHKPGENARTLLARLGKERIVAALRQDTR
ncbi:precorrin-3B synthase [Agrobacterium rubi TR3 = NBRC 13261]|uniref:Precorrin-3B synthase n=1 Tax=Agrobacterium rubi TR3 = NBRC 13261 TaxID=1368415 RepID=A0A081CXS6_9HYPH|nr:precorrin-3B synthase [Agrobacterium rubi]MBP1879594.1 precorrin-3B synthase [Agrobacterium rubi]MCL6654307.1 precorrin-3B synthase [Agrobacterium rubi]GAK71472.1 precorrin-3B synthase [Agrobacterium rubi TR3 = NBRC 13261]